MIEILDIIDTKDKTKKIHVGPAPGPRNPVRASQTCIYCWEETALEWDVKRDGYQIFCPHCGQVIMLCDLCDHKNDNDCGWDQKEGCRYSDERFRKDHANDNIGFRKKSPGRGNSLRDK